MLCPPDCHVVDYTYTIRTTETNFNNELWHMTNESNRYYRRTLVWDSTQPMLVYREEPVLSFTDYLCYCGGLLGLWFGSNANDLLIKLIELKIWRYINQYCNYF